MKPAFILNGTHNPHLKISTLKESKKSKVGKGKQYKHTVSIINTNFQWMAPENHISKKKHRPWSTLESRHCIGFNSFLTLNFITSEGHLYLTFGTINNKYQWKLTDSRTLLADSQLFLHKGVGLLPSVSYICNKQHWRKTSTTAQNKKRGATGSSTASSIKLMYVDNYEIDEKIMIVSKSSSKCSFDEIRAPSVATMGGWVFCMKFKITPCVKYIMHQQVKYAWNTK